MAAVSKVVVQPNPRRVFLQVILRILKRVLAGGLQLVFAAWLIPAIERFVLGRNRAYLDGVSASWLKYTSSAHILGVIIMKEHVDCDTISQRVAGTFLGTGIEHDKFGRFKELPVDRLIFSPYWRRDTSFDISRHVVRHAERVQHGEHEIVLARLGTEGLDPAHPLWQIHVFERFIRKDGSETSAVVVKMHHCYGDGFSIVRVMLQGAEPRRPPQSPPKARAANVLSPLQTFTGLLSAAKKLLLLTDDPVSRLKSGKMLPLHGNRTVSWHEVSHSVDDLKAIGRAADATVNDVLVAALEGSLRHAIGRLEGARPPSITAVMWVSMSPLSALYEDPAERPIEWTNGTLGAVYVPLVIDGETGERRPRTQLEEVRTRLRSVVGTPEPLVSSKLIALFGALPKLITTPLWNALCNKVTVSVSNIPGPPFAFRWLDVPVDSAVFFVPPAGTIGIFVTMLTLNGKVIIGMGSDDRILGLEALREVVSSDFEQCLTKIKNDVLSNSGGCSNAS